MTTTDSKEIDRLKDLAEDATPGPWMWTIFDYSMASLGNGPDAGSNPECDHVLTQSPCDCCRDLSEEWEWGRCTVPSEADAKYIAAAHPGATPSLIGEIDRLRAENERLREALESIVKMDPWAAPDLEAGTSSLGLILRANETARAALTEGDE